MRLILASTSAYRASLLQRLGLPFETADSGVDEDNYKSLGLEPAALTERLALAKAMAVSRRYPDAAVIGGDQVATLGDMILGKPGSHEAAVAQLAVMSGRAHQLVTALAVIRDQSISSHVDITTLVMRSLSLEEIERYLRFDQPYDCAGSYKLESRGITLFESIQTEDHTAIVGLPLIALTSILRELGFQF